MAFSFRGLAVLVQATLEGSIRTFRAPGLFVVALLPTFLLVGLIAYGQTGASLIGDYEGGVVVALFPLVLLLVTLLLAVPLFRDEIDDQSISYLLTRTLGKPAILMGKYLGCATTATLVLQPTVLLGYAIVASQAGADATALNGVLPSVVVMTEVGILAYVAIFLLMGLLTRRALIVGLLYAFVWEFLLGELAGFAPDLSILHYLFSISRAWVATGILATYPTALTVTEAIAVPLLVAVIVLALAVAFFWETGVNPSPD